MPVAHQPDAHEVHPVLGPCLVGAFVVALPELVGLGDSPPWTAVTVLALFLAVGILSAAAWGTAILLVELGRLRGWRASAMYSAPTLLVTLPGSRHLFDGAFAATLPGARWGHLWVPLVGLAGTAVVLHLARNVAHRHRRVAGLLAVGGAVALDLVNRTVKRSELFDLHTMLTVATVVVVAVGLWLLAPLRKQQLRTRVITAMTVSVVSVLVPELALADGGVRRAISEHTYHGRLLVRAARLALDGDGDGYSARLGGSDCDDEDPEVHPAAPDPRADGVDRNCDGHDGPTEPPAHMVPTIDDVEALENWRGSDVVRRILTDLRGRDVVLITVDTLRADLLLRTPENRERYPSTFALFDESTVFLQARSPSAGTDLSLSGLLTGKIDPFSGASVTLPEALRAAGHGTYGVLPSETLRYVGKTLLTRGLDEHRRLVNDMYEKDVGSYSTSHRTTDLGLEYVDRHLETRPDAPLFLWVHYFDLHEHHELDGRDRRLRDAVGDVPREWAERYRVTYRLVDREIGRLVQGLRDRGRWDEALVVLASDHGESLGQDPRLPQNHGLVLYEGLVHVPLAVRIPGQLASTVDTPVSLIDLFPTLLELVGQPVPNDQDGHSLVPLLIRGGPPVPDRALRHPIPLHESDQLGVVAWPYKLLLRPADNVVELYDLERDPQERHDLSREEPDRVAELQALRASFPPVSLDRTRKGRRARERAATPPSP